VMHRLWPLALLVAAGTAQAQFDYGLYGTADLSYGRVEPSGATPRDRFTSNALSASFFGVNARYGFESGFSAGLNLETFLQFQDFDYGRNEEDPFLSRNAFVSLTHADYGTVRLGRLQSYLFEATTRFNAFGNSIGFSPAVRHVFLSGGLESVQGDFYWDWAASYATPKYESGWSGQAMYARGRDDRRGDYLGGYVVYSRGVFAANVGAQKVHVDDGIADETDETTWQAGVSYNFGFARAFGQYTWIDDRGNDLKTRSTTAGVSVPLGPGNVLAQVAYTTSDGTAVDRRHTTTSLGYVYHFDSVTDFYVLGSDDRQRRQTRGLSYAVDISQRVPASLIYLSERASSTDEPQAG